MLTTVRARSAVLLTVAVLTAIGVTGCSSSSKSGTSSKKVAIVAYSVPKPAYDALSSAFQKTDAGKGVSFARRRRCHR